MIAAAASAPAAPAVPELSRAEWQRYQDRYAALAVLLSLDSCSVPGNVRAEGFAALLAPLLRRRAGRRVLDLGCGVAPLPVYLQGLDPADLYGIDPLPPVGAPHPFCFVQGEAEDGLPWPDAYFGAVVCATSLDHVRAPARVLAEAARVLEPGGLLVLWETVLPAALAGPDANHAYRFTWDTLCAALGPAFRTVALHWTGPPYCSDLIGVWERL